ncbi:hypothetical protein GCM10023083_64230 [Streptomyces phyllanthi]
MINLSVDKPAVFAETFRVLKPGGRIGVSDVVADDTLTPEQRAGRGDHVGCIAGALSFAEYRAGLETAGFTDVEITPALPRALGSARQRSRPTPAVASTPAALRPRPRSTPL